MASIVSAGTTSATALNMSADTTGILQLASNNGTVALTVTTAQDIGIGTTTPDIFSNSFARNFGIKVTGSGATCSINVSGGSGGAGRIQFGVETTRHGLIYVDATNFMQIATTTALPISFVTNNVEGMRLTTAGVLQFNSGYGSVADAYGCRAWVNFNGTGTPAIRASGNVSSITDNGTGDYTVNFTTAMPDANYSVSGSAMFPSATNAHLVAYGDNNGASGTLPTTSAFRLRTIFWGGGTATPQDCTYVVISVFR